MSKNKIIIVLLIMLSISSVYLYTTYAYEENNEEIIEKQPSNSDYNLIYSLTESSNKGIIIGAKEEKFIDISLKNTYDATIKYGMYYFPINPKTLPDNVTITLAEGSANMLEDTITSGETKSVSIRITNDSEYAIDLIIGALIGFEYGEIEDLLTEGEVLIK